MLVIPGVASAHYKQQKFESYAHRYKEYEHRIDHAKDVFRFFENHPHWANTLQGRAAIWQHKKLRHWSEIQLAKLNDIRYVHKFSNEQLAEQAREEVRLGGTYSVKYGDCSYRLKVLSRELVERAFRPYGTQSWALYIIDRESGFCPGAVNTTYSSWRERAQCIAQMIPRYHDWVDYDKCKSDPAYSVKVFRELSNGGKSTGPWN